MHVLFLWPLRYERRLESHALTRLSIWQNHWNISQLTSYRDCSFSGPPKTLLLHLNRHFQFLISNSICIILSNDVSLGLIRLHLLISTRLKIAHSYIFLFLKCASVMFVLAIFAVSHNTKLSLANASRGNFH